jgi:hypothetical protein
MTVAPSNDPVGAENSSGVMTWGFALDGSA